MFGNAKFRWFFLAPIVLALLVVASHARVVAGSQNDYIRGVSKNFLIADVYFDDGSVLHNAKVQSIKVTSHDNISKKNIKVKHENEIVTLLYEDLKTLEFVVEPSTKSGTAKVTLKIKTKTGVVINDRFSTDREARKLYGTEFCATQQVKFVSKLTGKEVFKNYGITKLRFERSTENVGSHCYFIYNKIKAISSIVFKD
jgi:hypothetical protein